MNVLFYRSSSLWVAYVGVHSPRYSSQAYFVNSIWLFCSLYRCTMFSYCHIYRHFITSIYKLYAILCIRMVYSSDFLWYFIINTHKVFCSYNCYLVCFLTIISDYSPVVQCYRFIFSLAFGYRPSDVHKIKWTDFGSSVLWKVEHS